MLPPITSLERVKRYLELETTDYDDLLEDILNSVSAAIRRYTRSTWTKTMITDLYNGTGKSVLTLGRGDVKTLISVKVDSQPQLSGDVLQLTTQAIIIKQGQIFNRGRANVEVSYEVGSNEVPDDIQQAAVFWTAIRFREKERIGISSKGIGPETVSFTTGEMPLQVREILDENVFIPLTAHVATLVETPIV